MANRCRIVVVGAGGVGKSALSVKYVQDVFVSSYDPSICEVYHMHEDVDGTPVFMDIVDTAGQEQYESMRAPYYKEADAFLVVYSVADRVTFEEVLKLRDDVLAERGGAVHAPMVVVGNKCDLPGRSVLAQEGRLIASQFFPDADDARRAAPFYETSALEGIHVADAFRQLIREVRQVAEDKKAAEAARAAAEAAAKARERAKEWEQSQSPVGGSGGGGGGSGGGGRHPFRRGVCCVL